MKIKNQSHRTVIVDPNLKYEIWVILCLAGILLITELGLRSAESVLSGNLRHISEIPAIVSEIGSAESSVLFLGNSLTNNAIDSETFNQPYKILQNRPPEAVLKITPDGTSLSDWYCIYENFLSDVNSSPKVVILGFAWAQLSDQYPIDPVRLGGYFCSPDDVDALASTGLSDHNNLLAFMAGAISHVYLNREAIRNRLLDLLVPAYQEITQTLNAVGDFRSNGDVAAANQQYTYHSLDQFIKMINRTGAVLIVVAMPVLEKYELDPRMKDVIDSTGATLIDLRSHSLIDHSMFADPIHLNNTGQAVFSRLLANRIEEITK